MKVGIVVLNYNKYEETIKCVESALKQIDVESSIVIVDNGSKNNSFEILKNKYSSYTNITIIKSDYNLGYAKGNNLGINYLRECNIDYIFVANSDIVFSTNSILRDICNGYEKDIGLIVPLIKNLNGTIDQRVVYKKRLLYLRIIKKIFEININFINKFFNYNKKNKDLLIEKNKTISGKNNDIYVISGSAFLLTPDFFSNYSGLYPETFLYFEEWATIIYLHKAKLSTKIINTNPIIHLGGASSYKGADADKVKLKFMKESSKKIFKLIFLPKFIIQKRYSYVKRCDK